MQIYKYKLLCKYMVNNILVYFCLPVSSAMNLLEMKNEG